MRRAFLFAAAVIVALAALAGLAGLIGLTRWSDLHAGGTPVEVPRDAQTIARGAYLARVGDCAACHSVEGRAPFSGGLRMATPVGAIYTSNITPDNEHGIGRYTLADFDRALRYGVAGGHTLYPAMPFSAYSTTTPADVAALYAYFMAGVKADATANRDNEIPFPLSMRWPLTVWRWMFAPAPQAYTAPAGTDAVLARGAYLVQGLGHCGDCHTARGPGLQVKALTAADGPAYLAGAAIDGWYAPSLRNGAPATIGAWSEEDMVRFLQSGVNRHGIAFASMSEVVVNSTQYLTDADALATARFLKSLPAEAGAASYTYDRRAATALRGGDASARGARLYLDNCAACHRPDGRGYEGVFPALAGNPVAMGESPQSVARIILQGMRTPRTGSTPAQFTMPAFDWRLSDQDVADVASFVRTSWGNHAPPVAAATVKQIRASLPANAAPQVISP